MEATHDEVVEAHEQEEVVRGVLVDDNGVWVDDEVLVQVHDEQVDDNEVLEVHEVHEVLVEVHEVLVDDTLEVVEVAEVQDGIVNEVSVVHDEEVARVHELVEEAVDDSEDDAQVVEVEVREQEAVHGSVVVGGNMDSNLEVEVHGRPTPHSPRRQVQLPTPLKMEFFTMYHEIQ